jgi:hypothetical protein
MRWRGSGLWAVTLPYRRPVTLGCDPTGVENETMTLPPRSWTLLAWSLWLVMFGCCAAGLLVTLALTRPLTLAVLAEGAVNALIFPLAYGTIGLVLMRRRPANPIGWLYAAAGLVWSLPIPLDPWVDQLIGAHRPLPLAAQLAAVAGEFLWAPAVALSITLPFLLLPNGQLRSRRWQPVVATSVTGAAMVLGFGSVLPGRLSDQTPIANPFGLVGTSGAVVTVGFAIGLALHVASLLAALVCVVLRFRASVGVERQQLRWVAAGATTAVAGLLLSTLLALGAVPGIADVIVNAALLCLPAAVAVAVLRYRLWDLDRLVSRTVTYALVTALLVVPYLLVVPAAGRLAQGSGSLAVAAATLAAVALFSPLRRRVQDTVDRRFNRRRYDAARTVEAFAARLRDQVDLDALHSELLTVVDQTMQPTQASLWLRPPAATRPSP